MRARRLVYLLMLPALLACASSARAATIVDLGTEPGNPIAVNDAGQVIGTGSGFTPGTFVWSDGTVTPLQALPTDAGYTQGGITVAAINDSGTIVGSDCEDDNQGAQKCRITTWSASTGTPTVPAGLDFADSQGAAPIAHGYAIDDAGDIGGGVEYNQGASQPPTAVYLPAGSSSPTLIPEGTGSSATGIWGVSSAGDLGLLGGTTYGSDDVTFSPGATNPQATDVCGLGTGSDGLLQPMASDGTYIGYREDSSTGCTSTPEIVAPGGVPTALPLGAASNATVSAVNASHTVVGSESGIGGSPDPVATMWPAGQGPVDLNTLLPANSGWVLYGATGIDNDGDIVGTGTDDGTFAAYLLTPGGDTASIAGSPSVAIPASGTATETFTVTLGAPSGQAVTVDYATQDGTATTANDDYTAQSGTLTFAPGQTQRTITIQIDDGNGQDTLAAETFQVNISPTATATVASSAAGTATGTITVPQFSGLTNLYGTGPDNPKAVPGMTVTATGTTTGGQPVTRTATSNANGYYELALDPGTYTLTPSGTPPGATPGQAWGPQEPAACPQGVTKAGGCQGVSLPDPLASTPTDANISFGYGPRDPQTESLDVVQGAQYTNWLTPHATIDVPGIGTGIAADGYAGAGLAAGGVTYARLYAGNKGAGAVTDVNAELYGYQQTAGGLVALPGSPLQPADNGLTLEPSPAAADEVTSPTRSFNFRLPDSWTHGTVTLVGRVDPAQQFPDCAGCRADDLRGLTGVAFTDVPALKFTPVSLEDTVDGKLIAPPDPTAQVQATWPFWPLGAGGLQATGPAVHVDLTAALTAVAAKLKAAGLANVGASSLPSCLGAVTGTNTNYQAPCADVLEPLIDQALQQAVPSPAAPVVAVYANRLPNGQRRRYGVLGASFGVPGRYAYAPDADPGQLDATIVHEMMHELGFDHTGCSPPPYTAWPANPFGRASLLGYGLNRATTGAGGIGQILTTTGANAGQGYHDIMSYCYPTWPSSLNWELLFKRLVHGTLPTSASYGEVPWSPSATSLGASIRRAASAAASAASVAPIATAASRVHDPVTVTVVMLDGRPLIDGIAPGDHAQAGQSATRFTVRVLGARGRVIERMPLAALSTHMDGASAPDDITTAQFVVPAAHAASIAITRGRRVVARMAFPRGRLTLRVARVRRAACRAPALLLRYRVRGWRGSPPTVLVYARVGGHYRLIEVGARGSRVIALVRGSLPRGARRLRVRYSNGVQTAIAPVTLPRACVS